MVITIQNKIALGYQNQVMVQEKITSKKESCICVMRQQSSQIILAFGVLYLNFITGEKFKA